MNNKEILKIQDIGGDFVAQEIIKRSKNKDIIYMTEDTLLNTNCVKQLAEYIESLIAENKELKEENLHWKGQYHLLSRKIDVIPKSKVEELMKELEKEQEEIKENEWILCSNINRIIIKVLQSLLGKE